MTTQESRLTNGHNSYPFSWRDLVAIGFRHKRPVLIIFFAILLGAVLAALIQPAEYKATTKFLIEHQRVDPIVSADKDTGVVRLDVPEEELNSEVELLQSGDVLQNVVLASGLHQHRTLLSRWVKGSEPKRIAKAVELLRKELQIAVVRKSDLISVSYTSSNPQLAVRVLQALADAYVQKNLAVHHPPGEFQFFDQETENYKKNLAYAETQLKTFSEQEGGVSPQLARDITLQKLSDFTASLQQTYADIAAAERRIDALEKQSGTTPQRLTTQLRAVDDVQVLQGLKTTLINLELKRTELLTKYQPTYPLVQEVDKEIADTLSSITREESKPVRDETTDRNPTYAWINEELAKAKADDSGLQARAAAIQATVARYQGKAHDLEEKGIVQQSLLRKVKTEEENYLLYQHKREEARMTDVLDSRRILNVAVAEAPTMPAIPSNSPWTVLFLGTLLATSISVAMAFTLEYTDSSLRTPSDVLSELNIPVLAAVPRNHIAFSNGNGHKNGNGSRNGNGNGVLDPAFAIHEATLDHSQAEE
jgi:uncharacterized protein involved in exopolysaccharide biosynthesis